MKGLAKFFGISSEKTTAPKREAATVVTETQEREINSPVNTELAEQHQHDVHMLAVGEIKANPFQPRKTFRDDALQDLAASVKEFGVIQPLLVRKVGSEYELVAGERRLRASKLAGLTEVPAIIKKLDDKEMAELAMIENLQREDLHFMEEAEGFHKLLENFGFTQEALAKRMGKSQSTIANKLRLLKMAPAVRQEIFEAELTERHARALLKLADEVKQLEAIKLIREKTLNVRETEELVKEMLSEEEKLPVKNISKQKVTRLIRDVRIFLNTINRVADEMKKSGLPVQVDQQQDDEYITLSMKIPKKKS